MRWLSVFAGLASLSFAPEVHARGPRAVPDLRRDAAPVYMQRHAPVALPVTVHIATEHGQPIARQRRIAVWLRRANEELAPFGIEVVIKAVRHLPRGFASVTRWRHRRRLAHYAPRDGTLHVFVTDRLDWRRERPNRRRIRGLHWEYRGFNRRLRDREYIVVTRGAPTTTFVHEIGHFLGLRHSGREDNIMCSCREGEAVGFSIDQGLTMRSGLPSFARSPRSWRRNVADRRRRRR